MDEETNPGSYTSVVTVAGLPHTAFPLLTPVEGFVTQGFDPSRNHFGIDIAAQRGTPVYAPGDGVVLFAGWTYEDGNMLIIAHGGGYLTVYKHNQTLLKNTLNAVKRGEPIALLGSTGKTSAGQHLHFEVWRNGVPQDPEDFLLVPSRAQ
jgi:murein DD-endopeptidase MepM/ murein hydrolase activator NlpD